ncbi:MAG: FHA domain-containing protein [Labilithrix sp.]|nr:FHA domain-containing protein [Labilithrix sp.]
MPLALSVWLDRSSLRPDRQGRCALAVDLAASGSPIEGERPAARTVLALDVSASMKGEPLAQVIRSVDRLLDALAGERRDGVVDEVGVVAFSENATCVVEPVRVDAAGKRLVRSRVGRLVADRGTNIEAGLDRSAELLASTPASMRRAVILLSDGAPNVGAHTSDALREVVRRHRPAISFFSLGYGVDHSEDVLSAIGDAGGGGYELVQDPAACARSFARALGAQGDVVAAGIELVVTPANGVELVRFVGREETRFSREGVVVSLPDMVNGARRLVVADLAVRAPGAERFVADVVEVTARWRSPASRDASSAVLTATLEVAEREPAVVPEAARRVFLARADEARDASRGLADRGQFAAAAAGLRATMAEIERLPGWVVNDGSPLAEAYELLVDEATAFERRPSIEAYAAFRKATVGSKLAASIPSAARSRGDASQKLIEHVAGDRPEAWLVAESNGARYPLLEECVIGRTNDADIRVESAQVSRRHAEVFANAGDYWIADLGSTNPTIVNGEDLGRAPHKLAPGDVVLVGDVELRYEEAPRKGGG